MPPPASHCPRLPCAARWFRHWSSAPHGLALDVSSCRGRSTRPSWTHPSPTASAACWHGARLHSPPQWRPPDRAVALRQLLLAAPAHWGLGALRTWANGWTTSSRMHEALLLPCCACGAANSDRLAHYLACPVFEFFIDEGLPAEWRLPGPRAPLAKLLLADAPPTTGGLAWLALAVLADHSHRGHRLPLTATVPAAARELRLDARAPGAAAARRARRSRRPPSRSPAPLLPLLLAAAPLVSSASTVIPCPSSLDFFTSAFASVLIAVPPFSASLAPLASWCSSGAPAPWAASSHSALRGLLALLIVLSTGLALTFVLSAGFLVLLLR